MEQLESGPRAPKSRGARRSAAGLLALMLALACSGVSLLGAAYFSTRAAPAPLPSAGRPTVAPASSTAALIAAGPTPTAPVATPTNAPTRPPTLSVTPSPSATATASPVSTPTDDPRLEQVLASMSLEDKIGQMLMPGIPGTAIESEAEVLIGQYRVGGIWLTSRNVLNTSQTASLVAGLAALGQAYQLPASLWISVDHEGGMINRFPYTSAITAFPGEMALGATCDPTLAYAMGLAEAQELRALGFNMNLAPVLDVNTNALNPVIGIRSFGSDPEAVTRFGEAYRLGLEAGGVIVVVKHFPGHGNVSLDSHFYLPTVPDDRLTLETGALAPFRAAVTGGVPAVMVGHLLVPALDPLLPASVSPQIVQGLLRDEWGFEGVVVSDDIRMRGLLTHYSAGQAAVMAVQAGVDLLPINSSNLVPDTGEIRAALLAAVASGQITTERIDASVRRLLRLKARFGLLGVVLPGPPPEAAANAALADQIARASITLLREAPGVLPLAPGARLLVITPDDGLRMYYPGANERTPLGLALGDAGFNVRELTYAAKAYSDSTGVGPLALALAGQYDAVLMGTWDAGIESMPSGSWQLTLARSLLARNPRLIGVALRTPYDSQLLPEVGTFFATYGGVPAQMAALAQVLLGQQPAPGCLPVDMPEVTP